MRELIKNYYFGVLKSDEYVYTFEDHKLLMNNLVVVK